MEKRTISLPDEHALYIDAKVTSGDYASASEVIRAGLRALQERDKAIEGWLHDQVAPVYDAMKKNPDRAIPSVQAFDVVRALHQHKIQESS